MYSKIINVSKKILQGFLSFLKHLTIIITAFGSASGIVDNYTDISYDLEDTWTFFIGTPLYLILLAAVEYKKTKKIFIELKQVYFIPAINFFFDKFNNLKLKLSRYKFIVFLKKYHAAKILFGSFIILFLLQHSKLTGTPLGVISDKNIFYSGGIINIDTSSVTIVEFEFRSLLQNNINYTDDINLNNYTTRRDGAHTKIYCNPHFIDKEILYIKATFIDMRTIFLLGFLFDYDKIFAN